MQRPFSHWIILSFLLISTYLHAAFYSDWIPPPSPILTPPAYSTKAQEEIPRFRHEHPGALSARQSYELALLYLLVHKNQEAKILLQQTLVSDPHFIYGVIQLGYIYLWEKDYTKAYFYLWRGFQEAPCNPPLYQGLHIVADHFALDPKTQKTALEIFTHLYNCNPDNPDITLSLGYLLTKMGQWTKAEHFFKQSLAATSDNEDAELGLANLYLMMKRWKDAENIYKKYPDNPEALKGLAKAESRQGHPSQAESYYKKVLAQNPKDTEARKEYARTLTDLWKFQESEEQYALLFTDDPSDHSLWNESFNVKSHTSPALLGNINYTASKENDPNLKQPVVRDFYLYSDLHSLIPLHNHALLDIKALFYNQKEVNIYNPSINYNADLAGIQLSSQYLFQQHWRWDAYARVYHAWQNGSTMNFPFQPTTRFEPGLTLTYNSQKHIAYLDLHIETNIIKNFYKTKSQVLQFFISELHYLLRPQTPPYPELEISVQTLNLFDGNFEDIETVWARCGFPSLEKNLIILYEFQHSHFNHLTPNYFSYKQQYCNFIGTQLHFPIATKGAIDLIYLHNWQSTKKLIQPIGTFLFIANSQLLTGNKITGRLTYRVKNSFNLTLEGHYFRDTLPYRDWNVKAALLWQF